MTLRCIIYQENNSPVTCIEFESVEGDDCKALTAFPSSPSVSVAHPAGMILELQLVAPNETTAKPRGEK